MIKYLVNGEEMSEKEFDSRLEDSVNDYYDEDKFAEYLDETYPEEITVMGLHFSTSQIVRECDPTAFRCERANFLSDKLEEVKDEVECRGYIEIDGNEFSIEDIDEEEGEAAGE